ncbi:MAG: hypothetical protein HYZ52_04350 [Candidatus Omnitrophica bacterium]|nr:hypothetical protein [Candidatus Omnitrophota bacterium]
MKILFFLDYVQDTELLLPIVKGGVGRGFEASVYFTDRLFRRFAATASDFQSLPIRFQVIPRWKIILGLGPGLRGFDALVTASESSLRPHAAAYALTRRANRLGIKTFTVQHGFEQVGLTYFDEKDPPGTVRFASQKIFVWGELSSLDPQIPSEVKGRCIPVGYPRELRLSEIPLGKVEGRPFTVTVFENLHWHRYSDEYRRRFMADLKETARRLPDTTFFVRPHPDQRWFTRHGREVFSGLKNLILADPHAPVWGRYGLSAFLRGSDAIITTPSTVALDAARAGVPVAVVAGDVDTSRYEPLFLIRETEDWFHFVHLAKKAPDNQPLFENSRQMVSRTVISGDAAQRILKVLRS